MPSIGVLEHYQQATDKPQKRVKRSDGQTIVRRGTGFWIEKNVLLKLYPPHIQAQKSPAQSARYIPFGLEPAIDTRIGVKASFPVLSNQIRVRPVRNQESYA